MTLQVFNITGKTPWEKRIGKKKESNRKMTANSEEWKRKGRLNKRHKQRKQVVKR